MASKECLEASQAANEIVEGILSPTISFILLARNIDKEASFPLEEELVVKKYVLDATRAVGEASSTAPATETFDLDPVFS